MSRELTELPDESRLAATAVCERCGGEVELWQEAVEWQEQDDGAWTVTDFGPATGVCCGLLYADWWEGTFVYDLGRANG